MTVHSEAALRHGASKDEIAEALGVAVAVTAGAALVYSKRSKNFREGEPDRRQQRTKTWMRGTSSPRMTVITTIQMRSKNSPATELSVGSPSLAWV
jgi:hypothetical protein